MTVLVTGAAGFIGFHLSSRLLENGVPVVGFDNINPYYDPNLKRARLAKLESLAKSKSAHFDLIEGDLEDRDAVEAVFSSYNISKVVNLAVKQVFVILLKSSCLYPD